MKKVIALLAVAAIYIILIISINREYSLNLNQFEHWIRADEYGNIYMVKNNGNQSDIIKINQRNQISVCCSQTQQSQITIVDIDVEKEDIYVLMKYSDKKNNTKKWQISKYSQTDFKWHVLFEMEKTIDIKELFVEKGVLYLSAETESQRVQIYEADLQKEMVEPELKMERDVSTLSEKLKNIVYYSGKIYILTCGGNVWRVDNTEPIKINTVEAGGNILLGRQKSLVYWYSQSKNRVYWSNAVNEVLDSEIARSLPKGAAIQSIAGKPEEKIHILAVRENGNTGMYILENKTLKERTQEINHSGKNNKAPVYKLIMATLIYLFIVAVVFFLIWGYHKSGRLILRLSIISMGMAVVLIATLTYAVHRNNSEDLKGERANLCVLKNQLMMKNLNSINNISPYLFYQSEEYKNLKNQLSDIYLTDSDEIICLRQYYLYSDKEIYVLGSGNDEVVTGSYARLVFSKEAYEVIKQGINEKDKITKVVSLGSETVSLTIAPVDNQISSKGFLVTTVSMQDIAIKEKAAIQTLLLTALCIMIITAILLVISLKIALHPIKRLSVAMSQAAEGKIYEPHFQFEKMNIPNHEIGIMWISFSKMCKALQNKNYFNIKVLHSYYRFIPRKLEKLLGKESILDVNAGDIKNINGAMELISVADKEDVYKNISNTEYMNYVNRCFRIISRTSEENQGVLLSNDSNLSSVKVMFPDSGEKAVTSGIEVINALPKTESQPVILIHMASYLYGVAGTTEQLCPFITSTEIGVLSGFVSKLRETGTKMVITEDTVKWVKRHYAMRYIGYITTENKKHTFKLYEVLEVYPEIQKNIRIKLNEKFQEGIRMFYCNDFYLARNIFSAILKECPEDGIARWYLFQCESMLNITDYDGIRYDLFA